MSIGKLSTVLAMALLVSGCVTIAVAKKPRTIPDGTWGGPHIQLIVQDGGATIEYDCANGSIEGPLKLDSRGRFSLLGKHFREHGGPIRIGEESKPMAARYTGRIDGTRMTLTVTLVNPKGKMGTYQLTRGSQGRVFKCR
jgi:hypothetical protein